MRWSEEEEDYIREHHAHMTASEIGEVLGRSRQSVRSKMRRLGVARTDEIVNTLRGANPTNQEGSANHNWKGGVSEKPYQRYVKRYKENNPEKVEAHRKVRRAIDRGEINRQPCEVCGEYPADAHHQDYSKPLDVTWLCRKHHAEIHGRE